MMLASLTFMFGSLLWAGAAVAAPVVIHLIMRTKPRELDFPALRFVRKTQQATLSKLKLKHLILLLMRMAALALIIMLLARGLIPAWTTAADTSLPVAAVFVVDDSASMGYQYQDRSLLAGGRALAGQVIARIASRSPLSRVAVIRTSRPAARAVFLGDLKLAAQQILEIEETPSDASVAAGMARAAALLATSDLPRREIYLVTDMTAQAWRDGGGMDLAAAKPAEDKKAPIAPRVIVLDCSAGQGANVSLAPLRMESPRVPVGVDVALRTELASSGLAGEYDLNLDVDAQPVDHRSLSLKAGQVVAVDAPPLTVQAKRPGLLQGRLAVRQSDPLAWDNVQYFTLQVGPPATCLVVREAATIGQPNDTTFLVQRAAAPSGGAGGDWVSTRVVTADRLSAADLKSAAIVLLSDVGSLGESQWRLLEDFVSDGGGLWVVVGSMTGAASYNTPAAQKLMPASLGALETLEPAVGWDVEKPSPHALLAPFVGEQNPPLTEVRCRRRFTITALSGDATDVVHYADKTPAIVTRQVGRGTVLLWNFSPARPFSNLAPLPQFPVLAQRAVQVFLGGLENRTAYTWGAAVSVPFPQTMRRALVAVRRPGSEAYQGVVTALNAQSVTLPADAVGNWVVRFTQDDRQELRGFSVNPDSGESDLKAEPPADALKLLPPRRAGIVSKIDQIVQQQDEATRDLDLTAPGLLLLLALMAAESFFSNRFYRKGTAVELSQGQGRQQV
ncbi:MAG: BatA domain-containing protein [Planctomycetaceae bacterium]|nr:BatA domain-containing protein [Planctomycetaceae bacterium]